MHTDILIYAEQQKSGAVTMSGGHFDYSLYIADQLERDT